MFSSNTSQVSNDVNYIEDVFSTYLYTGNGSTQTITNGIDLAGKGGLVWCKVRNTTSSNFLFDTARGANALFSNLTNGQQSEPQGITSFNANGFTLGTNGGTNGAGNTFVSWTFRKQPKFFDVVTWTGDGIAGRVIPHNLGSVPGCVIGKRTSATSDWTVYHRSLNGGTNPDSYQVLLNSTAAQSGPGLFLLVGAPTSTNITLALAFNQIGVTYVAYLFAHNAGGFGLTGTDNVISCGSFTTDGSGNATVNLGYEPQFGIFKCSTAAEDWVMKDSMRGWVTQASGNRYLLANSSAAEAGSDGYLINSTGFSVIGATPSSTYIYIAIRRGPMKTPTTGTSVFSPIASSAASGTALTTNFPIDAQFGKYRSGSASWSVVDRLRGVSTTSTEVGLSLATNSTAAEGTASGADSNNWGSTGFSMPTNLGGISDIFYNFRRAPGFFDQVCYTGTGSARTVAHNLAAVPELMIVKSRNNALDWYVYHADIGNTKYIRLNIVNGAQTSVEPWNNTTPTASVFTTGIGYTNESGYTYVNYLFASCPGVSKVGSYTGTGTTQQINCGFTAGARFVLIKRTDSTGDWYVWDSARGIVAGNDPYLLLNSTAAEVTTTDYVDTFSSGFEISSTAPAAINASGGTFIYLAIA